MRASLLASLLGACLFIGTGCSEYHYFVVDVTLDTTLNGNGVRSSIQRCGVKVSNGDEFRVSYGTSDSCPLANQTSGTFEYSTKDSGELKFTFSVYDSQSLTQDCEIGRGETTIPDSETTNHGTLTVMANGSAGCT
jgi:hypothetical protein